MHHVYTRFQNKKVHDNDNKGSIWALYKDYNKT